MKQSFKLAILLVALVGFLVSQREVESCGFTREAAIALLRRINDTFPNLIQQQYPSGNSNSNNNNQNNSNQNNRNNGQTTNTDTNTNQGTNTNGQNSDAPATTT